MIHNNLLLTDEGDIWGYYKIAPQYIANQNQEQKEKSKDLWSYTINSLEKYEDIHFEMYPPKRDLKEQFEELKEDLSPDSIHIGKEGKLIGQYYGNETVRMLESEFGEITYSSFVVGVKLRESQISENIKDAIKESYEQVTSRLLSMLGFDKETDESFFDRFKDAEDQLFSILKVVNAVRLEESEMIYLNRYNFIRDIPHSVEDESTYDTLYHLSDPTLDQVTNQGFIKIGSPNGKHSYVSVLPISDYPKYFKGNHLFSLAQEVKFPCELHIKAHFENSNGMLGLKSKLSGKNRKFKVNTREAIQDGDQVGQQLIDNRVALQIMMNDLELDKPILRWLGCFVVYGKTLAECRKNGDRLKQQLGIRNITIYRPAPNQLELFYKLLQGGRLSDYRYWQQWSNAEGLSEMLFGVNNLIGNNTGWYIGRVDDSRNSKDRMASLYGSRKIVLVNPMATNQNVKNAVTASPHMTITGQTGKGKSYLIKLLFYYLSFMNMKILYIDPKKEMRDQFQEVIDDPYMNKEYSAFVEHLKSFHYVTLDASKKENWGTLDPIVFLDRMQAKETAESMFFQLYDVRGRDEVHVAIVRAISDVLDRKDQGEKVGMMNVVDILRKDEDKKVRACGELLTESIKDSILKLGFSHGENTGVSLDQRITIMEVSGLDLPKESDDPEYYSDAERKSICLMLPLGKFCEMFGSKNQKEYTAEIFDEAWIFSVAKGGKRVLKSIKRVGRSMSNMCVIVTQSIFDVSDEENKGQEGMIFAFDEPSERKEILDHMQIEVTDENKQWLSGMLQGQCLFKDIYGKVGKITVHCLFEEMDHASKTVDKGVSGSIEEKFAMI